MQPGLQLGCRLFSIRLFIKRFDLRSVYILRLMSIKDQHGGCEQAIVAHYIDIGITYSVRTKMLSTLPCRCFKNPSIMTFTARSRRDRYSTL